MDGNSNGSVESKVYKLELDEQRIRTYITGLDSSVKVIANQLLQNNSAQALRNLLPQLINLNNEFMQLDQLIDKTNKETNYLNHKEIDISNEKGIDTSNGAAA